MGIDFYKSGLDRTFSIGTTIGGTDIADNEFIPANNTYTFDKILFFETSVVLYFSGITATAKIYIL
jgi:hypothetical protein